MIHKTTDMKHFFKALSAPLNPKPISVPVQKFQKQHLSEFPLSSVLKIKQH